MPADSAESLDERGHRLQKSVWTDADYGSMGWHDCALYAFALVQDAEDDFAGRLLLDIDYIVRWVVGTSPDEPYTFWMSPATLIFHGVSGLKGMVDQSHNFPQEFEIDALTREAVADGLAYDRWTIESELNLSFRAAGFRQVMRREPAHVTGQYLTMERRGGLSFSEQPYDGAASSLSATHAANPPAIHRIARPIDGSASATQS